MQLSLPGRGDPAILEAMVDERVNSDLAAGWRALGDGRWPDARVCFERAIADGGGAEAEGYEGLGWVGYCLDEEPLTFDARQRAFGLYRDRGDRRSAARVAAWLATDCVEFRGEFAIANGWLRVAHHLIDDLEPGTEHGWLALHEGALALELNEDTETARRLGARAAELGRQFGVPELEMVGCGLVGRALVCEGHLADGMRRLDEATAVALAGGAQILSCVSWTCCHLITACERVRDYDRARQWCGRAVEFGERHGLQMFVSDCRAQYGSVLIWQGQWARAEQQLLLAAEGLAPRPPLVEDASVRLGELRRRQGRLDEAEEFFARGEGHLLAPLGRAAIALDRGRPLEASDQVDRYLRRLPAGRVERFAGLELAAQAHLMLGDLHCAADVVQELREISGRVPTAAVQAAAVTAEGRLAGAGGDPEAARRSFEDALDLLIGADGPFEIAVLRLDLAVVLAGLHRDGVAIREAETALLALRRLGAAHEAARAETILGRLGAGPAGRSAARGVQLLSPREREVLILVAQGLTNGQIAEQLVLSEHTVHRHVTNMLRKLRAPSRAAAAALAARSGLG